MSRNVHTYGHFCTLARALERVGDRWTLLVVRDLLGGPRRFTDLMALLGGITPKTLTQRLRELQDAGIVEVDRQPGRREVWYRLSPAGEDLAPVVESLFLWGLHHAGRSPLPGERVHPEHLLKALRLVLDRAPSPRRPVAWRLDVVDAGTYTLRFDGGRWALVRDVGIVEDGDDADHGRGVERPAAPDVVVTTDTDALVRYLTTPPARRPTRPPGIELRGPAREVERLLHHLARFPPEGTMRGQGDVGIGPSAPTSS